MITGASDPPMNASADCRCPLSKAVMSGMLLPILDQFSIGLKNPAGVNGPMLESQYANLAMRAPNQSGASAIRWSAVDWPRSSWCESSAAPNAENGTSLTAATSSPSDVPWRWPASNSSMRTGAAPASGSASASGPNRPSKHDRAYILQDTQFVLICTQSTTTVYERHVIDNRQRPH